jgi:iron(III) transport system ATP-binding protein
MVFQNLGLWPHLTARQHVECLGSSGESLLREVRLPREAWDRRPHELSGGEGQRVGLARALASNPQILLLDEPLAHLDAALRGELLEQLGEVIRQRGLTALFVTHAWQEAVKLCPCIGVLEQGRLAQAGPADELYWKPADLNVARLTGPLISLPRAWLAEGRITGDANASGLFGSNGERIWLRPQHLRLVAPEQRNLWRVADCRPSGAGWQIRLEADEQASLVIAVGARVAPGEQVGLQIYDRGQPAALENVS